jgi:hypothetical protein
MERGQISCRCRTLGAPQDGFEAGHQLPRIKWLRQVIVGAQLEPPDLMDIFIPRRQHQDRTGGLGCPQAAADLEAIQLWKHHVQHNQCGVLPSHFLLCSFSILGRLNPKPLTLEVQAREVEDRWLVVDEEDELIGHDGSVRSSD